MREELRQRFATECRYAVNKMMEVADVSKKMFYFSAVFGEAQRLLNLEWDRNVVLVFIVTQQAYNQINVQLPLLGSVLPIKLETVFEELTKNAAALADYLEKDSQRAGDDELCQILARFAEITYATQGNGSYLYERGKLKL
jgi:hypothetical protein